MTWTRSQLNGRECHVLHISVPQPGVAWKRQTEKAVAEIKRGEGAKNAVVVIHGQALAGRPNYSAAITCALATTGASVYVGEETSYRSGVARCVHHGRDDAHSVGDRHWYSQGSSREEARISETGGLLWTSVRPGFQREHEHQVLVSSRRSMIDRVVHNLQQRIEIEKGKADGDRMRATRVHGPDKTHERLGGFWNQVLKALETQHGETPESSLALGEEPKPSGTESRTTGHETTQQLEERAMNALYRYWRGRGKPGVTLLVVNDFDTWCRQWSEAHEVWALQRHLQNSNGFIILGCANEWPASDWLVGHSETRIRIHRIE